MKIRTVLVAASALLLAGAAAQGQMAESAPAGGIAATLDTQQVSPPVSKYVFGMFIEHIGKTMYGPLWAEMLDDRKFYFPITSAEPQTQGRRGFPGMQLRRWRPIGGDDVVSMDKDKPFAGAQSSRVTLDASTPHGIRQPGLALVKGKHYTGRIWLRGTPGSKVKVVLVWGEGANDRESITIPITAAYAKYPLHFTAAADASDAALEITGTGKGDFHIGAVSLMPADNIQGFRPDTIALIRQIKSGFWRFGGNYTANYTWYDAIGDPDQRPPTWDHAWNQMQTNDLGPDEFAEFCKLIGVEPYISVNAGLGDAHSAAEEVEYMNGALTTRLGALRAKNGHPAPWHIRFWNIGNEPWGSWEIGRTDLKYFMQKHNDFAAAMRKADPSIVLIASGEMLEDGQVPPQLRSKYVGNLAGAYGSDFDWTGGFLRDCWGNFDGMAEHWYAQPGRRYNVEKAKNLKPEKPNDDAFDKIDQTTLEYARYPANIVRSKAEEWEGYQQRFPAMLKKNTFLSIDEYAYFGGAFGRAANLKQALAYAMLFNEMLRHTDSLTMAAHTMGTSTIDFNQTSSTFNTLGQVFKLYSNNFPGTIPVAITGNSPQPAPQYPPAPDQPKVSSGSPTYPLDVFAALTPDRKFLTVAVVNATDSEQKLDLNVAGTEVAGPSTLWQLTGKSLDAVDRLGQPPEVEVKEIPLGSAPHSLTVAPISINVYRFPVAQ
ncbi:MAG: alpha-N-arabinofuranosidase [Terracidiphilus sp.]